jgi:uncharacterized protein (DUF302 family)
MSRTATAHAFRARLELPYEQAVEKVSQALAEEGFGVLTQIDVRQTLRQKLDAEFRRYVILGACHPALAHRALAADLEVGLLLPCNVIVYEEGGGSQVAILHPLAMVELIPHPDLQPVAQEAQERLQRVLQNLPQ